ncbi:hypothetical protein [Streptomyces sp. NPDC007205]|uniref:hypothetical protein n=1 Tax=Streptomyces sp. NPDC007205 TaxID=3154316 RepID=UPI003405570D
MRRFIAASFSFAAGRLTPQARDLAEPALLLGLIDAGVEVGDDLAQAGRLREIRL